MCVNARSVLCPVGMIYKTGGYLVSTKVITQTLAIILFLWVGLYQRQSRLKPLLQNNKIIIRPWVLPTERLRGQVTDTQSCNSRTAESNIFKLHSIRQFGFFIRKQK